MSCFQIVLRLRSFLNKEPRIRQELALAYRRRFQQSIFYQACESSLRFITPESIWQFPLGQEQQWLPVDRPTSRKSVTSVSHYENANVNFNSQNSGLEETLQGKLDKSIPNTIQYMSTNQKQELLKQLVQKSYLFVDLSDLFSREDLQTYQQIVRKQIFQGQQSIVGSILENGQKKGVKDKLKYFDSEALHLLKTYVDFCTQMLRKLKPFSEDQDKQRNNMFLPRLILQLKARLQLQFPDERVSGKFSQLNKLVSEYKVMNTIILSTLQITQKIHIIPQDSHEYAQNFFTYPNVSTLVTVILFMDQHFLKAIFQRFLQGLKICASRMTEKINVIQQKFLDQLKASYFGVKVDRKQSSKKLSTESLLNFKSNLQKILSGQSQSKPKYFKRSLRTLQTLTQQKQPIKCLKIIYQLNKTIQKQHTQFINELILKQSQSSYDARNFEKYSQVQDMRKSQKTKKYSFSRETQCSIIEYLLSKKKDKLRFIIANIMMTHFFVHQNLLKDKKGSCLAPFVQIVKQKGLQ